MGKFSILLLLVSLIVAVVNAACTFKDTDGKFYDFSSLSTQDHQFSSEGFDFVYRFCNVVSQPACNSLGGSFCFSNGAKSYNIGRWSNNKGPTITGKVSGGLTLAFSNGDLGPGGSSVMKLNIHLSCGKETTPTATSLNANFDMVMTHPAGCPVDEDDGLSGGAIFLIILASVIPVYIIGGCAYNHKVKGTSLGLPSCPQRDFWAALPGLVKDGVIFTVTKLRGLCNKGATTTESAEDYGTMA